VAQQVKVGSSTVTGICFQLDIMDADDVVRLVLGGWPWPGLDWSATVLDARRRILFHAPLSSHWLPTVPSSKLRIQASYTV